jgi:hypothetical protein
MVRSIDPRRVTLRQFQWPSQAAALLALLWQINDFCDSLGGVSVIHWEPAFEGAGDGSGLD